MNIGQDVLKPCQVLLGLLFAGRKGIVILVKLLPDDGENEMHLQFIIRQRRLRNPMNIFDLVYNILVPFYLFLKLQGMPALVCSDKVHIFRLQKTVLIPINKSGMEGDGEIGAVFFVYHIAGVERVAVAKQSLAFAQEIFLIVYQIFNLSRHNPCKLNLWMPVPGERILLICLNFFQADMNRKFIVSMLLDFFLVFLWQ